MPDKNKKKIFYGLVFLAFVSVTIFSFLTPAMCDDIIYGDTVAEANNFFDIFVQEYEHYMGHSGRSVAHIMLRIFLYIGSKAFFNIVAGIVFAIQTLLIYANIDNRKKYDIGMYSLVVLFLWFFDPTMSNSVFWETGACNYLFTSTIMLAFITIYRKKARSGAAEKPITAVRMFVLGLLSGWCNENTSGGVILFLLILLYLKYRENKDFKFIKPWMITGLVGCITGLAFLVLAPGNGNRKLAAIDNESHSGLLAFGARFLKVTLNIKDNYMVLTMMFAVLLVVIAYMMASKSKFFEMTGYMRLMGFIALATAYAVVAVPGSPQLRTLYGAGIFLMIAVLNGIAVIANTVMLGGSDTFPQGLLQMFITSCTVILAILLVFTYIEQGANLARIKGEFDERDAYLKECAANGEDDVDAPMLRPGRENRFTMAYESDISDDPDYWINDAYRWHYGIDNITGIPRDEWNELYE
ncbi:DUF3329 domain-containing protein [Butyrivibrio sp. INlla21]|uniref:DUF3329 domain-containing protein n=1 Tax=Butyrivibrio sp. INlla21 TaxID=1520811 RepID=UPI0008E1CD37|nr:DUF6056 family protein [Butyrivibrio sp. INlla21]SFU66791.1 hypothetical protein SAMN02910342_01301 [Butyrivibrio sp. INlla21]